MFRVSMLIVLGLAACHPSDTGSAGKLDVSSLSQGWSDDDRGIFYTASQGSQIMPAAWFAALKRPGSSDRFAADKLARYGYLPASGSGDLPVGFVVDPASGALGMTCAACHTGQLSYKGTTWRIDGGRAGADFQAFLTDLVAAARVTVASPDSLDAFAKEAAGSGASPDQVAAAKRGFTQWTSGFGDFMDRSLPKSGWGPGRLDAFGMIFNRVTGLDLAIPANYRPADAPVRYPFLWNAALQDRTQWDGAAPNGSYVKAMARNTGEVFGVFGKFNPETIAPHVVLYANSVNYRDLQSLEQEIVKLKPPAWPSSLSIDQKLADHGHGLYDQYCAACHAIRPSESVAHRWATPVCRVGTDPLMYQNALLDADSGKLGGTLQLSGGGVLGARDKKVSILANAVVGSLILNAGAPDTGIWRAINQDVADRVAQGNSSAPPARTDLPAECRDAPPASDASGGPPAETTGTPGKIASETKHLYELPSSGTPKPSAPGVAAYEARVLNGVWAAAPYLHNGSVPSLAELLKPAAERARVLPAPATTAPEFDPVGVGVAAAPAGTAPPGSDAPGNSNAGHDYGTSLAPADRQALLEYLKTL